MTRLPPTAPAALDGAVAAFEHASIPGFNLRLKGTSRLHRANTRTIVTRVLVAPTEVVRDAWLAALRLQLAPAKMIAKQVAAVARGAAAAALLREMPAAHWPASPLAPEAC